MNNNIDELMHDYYKNYYKSDLGLSDWEERLTVRLNEETKFSLKYINMIEELFCYDFSGKKVLIVGCGTGGELVSFHKKGADAHGIEPNIEAIKICYVKAKKNNIPNENIRNAYAENLPYDDNFFDFIYCVTVLEHVADIKKSINEMVRCTKVNGKIFLEMPNHTQLYEAHYKLPLPMFLPKWFNKVILKILRRPTDCYDDINRVNAKMFLRIFNKYQYLSAMRIFNDNSYMLSPKKRFSVVYIIQIIQFLIYKVFLTSANQMWILHKTNLTKDSK